MQKKEVCLGMIGAGRATELHMNAIHRYSGVPVRCKTIVARRWEQVVEAKNKYGFETATLNVKELLEDPEIDVIDICTPPYMHEEMIIQAMEHGKHVICEKPLCGCFDTTLSKTEMYESVLNSLEKIDDIIRKTNRKFMYAENYIYAPAINKAAEIITKKKCRILFAKGEESLKGSSSAVAGEWSKTGGGTFIRTGAHPLSAILWLKQVEAKVKNCDIKVDTVLADMGCVTKTLSEYDHRHIAARPIDVEATSTVILKFSDESRATIMAADTLLGGSLNYVDLYCNDAVIKCNLTMADMMSTYFLDEERLDDVYISEMLPGKTGWNNPFLEDEIMRGYTDEMRDFIEAVYYDREPKSGISIARDTIKIIYAAYKSAELKQAVELE